MDCVDTRVKWKTFIEDVFKKPSALFAVSEPPGSTVKQRQRAAGWGECVSELYRELRGVRVRENSQAVNRNKKKVIAELFAGLTIIYLYLKKNKRSGHDKEGP